MAASSRHLPLCRGSGGCRDRLECRQCHRRGDLDGGPHCLGDIRGAELKAIEKDRYLTITNQLFAVWQTAEFVDAQLWLLHRLEETTWPDFIRAHRAGPGEAAFHRVGAFYDRVGTLIRLGLIRQEEMLPTIGGYAIAVWQKVRPLVFEARRLEHSTLFTDFERLLPACHECYVPAIGAPVAAPELAQVPRVSPAWLSAELGRGTPMTILDVRQPSQVAAEPQMLPGAVHVPVDDVERRRSELPANRAIITYCA